MQIVLTKKFKLNLLVFLVFTIAVLSALLVFLINYNQTIPNSWRRCTSDSDCVYVKVDEGRFVSVNREYAKQATGHLCRKAFRDPYTGVSWDDKFPWWDSLSSKRGCERFLNVSEMNFLDKNKTSPCIESYCTSSHKMNFYEYCIGAGTLIDMESDRVFIENLEIGDRVVSLQSDGSIGISTVTSLKESLVDSYLKVLLVDGTELTVTASHPLRSGNRWIPAGDVRPGDLLHTVNGEREVMRSDEMHESITVYDLSVTPHENFFANGVLVHNKSIAGATG